MTSYQIFLSVMALLACAPSLFFLWLRIKK